jgi:hypothetical protein
VAFADSSLWTPDLAQVTHIEQLLRQMPMPKKQNWVSDSFDSYGRYYTGLTEGSHKVIYANFYSLDSKLYPPGVHVGVDFPVTTGGLCAHLTVRYDVAEDRVTEFECYGLG